MRVRRLVRHRMIRIHAHGSNAVSRISTRPITATRAGSHFHPVQSVIVVTVATTGGSGRARSRNGIISGEIGIRGKRVITIIFSDWLLMKLIGQRPLYLSIGINV